MILHRSPDGMSYGQYGQFGFWPIVEFVLQAIPAITSAEFPQGAVHKPPSPPSNLPLMLGIGAAGLVAAGVIALVLRKPKVTT